MTGSPGAPPGALPQLGRNRLSIMMDLRGGTKAGGGRVVIPRAFRRPGMALRARLARAGRTAAPVLALALVAAGCGARGRAPEPHVTPARPGYQSPDSALILVSGEFRRSYRLHLPARPGPEPMPLLIALHGYGGSGENLERVTGFDSIADREHFVVAYPNGRNQMWNAGGRFEGEGWWHTDDVAFISDLIDALAHRYPIDRRRVFVTGFSNGGFMAYRLARELSREVVAIAPVAGSLLKATYDEPVRDVAILHLHGLADTIVPFDGGMRNYGSSSVETVLAYWIREQRCARAADTVFDSAGIVGRRWKSRSGRGDVLLYTAAHTGHQWWTRSDPGISASELIWSFFKNLPPR